MAIHKDKLKIICFCVGDNVFIFFELIQTRGERRAQKNESPQLQQPSLKLRTLVVPDQRNKLTWLIITPHRYRMDLSQGRRPTIVTDCQKNTFWRNVKFMNENNV